MRMKFKKWVSVKRSSQRTWTSSFEAFNMTIVSDLAGLIESIEFLVLIIHTFLHKIRTWITYGLMYISKRIHEFTWILVVQEQDFELGRRSLVVDCCPLYLIVDVVKLLLWNLLLALWRCYCYAVKFITHMPTIFRRPI